jgi:hypothetical protein
VDHGKQHQTACQSCTHHHCQSLPVIPSGSRVGHVCGCQTGSQEWGNRLWYKMQHNVRTAQHGQCLHAKPPGHQHRLPQMRLRGDDQTVPSFIHSCRWNTAHLDEASCSSRMDSKMKGYTTKADPRCQTKRSIRFPLFPTHLSLALETSYEKLGTARLVYVSLKLELKTFTQRCGGNSAEVHRLGV